VAAVLEVPGKFTRFEARKADAASSGVAFSKLYLRKQSSFKLTKDDRSMRLLSSLRGECRIIDEKTTDIEGTKVLHCQLSDERYMFTCVSYPLPRKMAGRWMEDAREALKDGARLSASTKQHGL
jgi:hypothetical protein